MAAARTMAVRATTAAKPSEHDPPVLSGGIMPAKETPAEEMPRRGVGCGRLSGRAERRLHLHYSNAAVCIEVLTLVLLRRSSETNLAETRKDRLDVLTDMLAHARIFVPNDLALDAEWRGKTHAAVEAAASEGGLAAEVRDLLKEVLADVEIVEDAKFERRADRALAEYAGIVKPGQGYTLLMTGTFNAINATLYENLSFNFIRDIAPVASLSRTAGVMEVNPSFPAKTVPEFIAYAKANPRKVMMASAGPGSAPGLYGELFKSMTGVDLAVVNYRGSPAALSDLIAGHVHVTCDPIASSVGYIKAGQLRALGVTTAKRIEVLPDVPTIGEFVPGYEASG
jgi:Tripartite tricarboxylate transporter family receptor